MAHTRCTEEDHNTADVTSDGNCGLRRAAMINAARGLRASMAASLFTRRSTSAISGANKTSPTMAASTVPRYSSSDCGSALNSPTSNSANEKAEIE